MEMTLSVHCTIKQETHISLEKCINHFLYPWGWVTDLRTHTPLTPPPGAGFGSPPLCADLDGWCYILTWGQSWKAPHPNPPWVVAITAVLGVNMHKFMSPL